MAATPPQVTIRAEVSVADPNTCRFFCSQTVHPGGPYVFPSKVEATGSPLPEHLFALTGITHVLISDSIVTITKREDLDWGDFRKRIGQIIRAQLTTASPAILDSVPDIEGRAASGERDNAALTTIIEQLFSREVNPRLAAHGGSISLVGIDGSTLTVAMHGGCQGCASSQLTLRGNVEVMVRRVAPEITEIVDASDHANGDRPYFVASDAPVTIQKRTTVVSGHAHARGM